MRWFVTEHPVRMILSSWWTTGSRVSFFFFFFRSRYMSSLSFQAKPWPLSPATAWMSCWYEKKKRKPLPPLKQSGGEIWTGLQGNMSRGKGTGAKPTRNMVNIAIQIWQRSFILRGKSKWCSINWSWHCGTFHMWLLQRWRQTSENTAQ